jgi:hypothetical protein
MLACNKHLLFSLFKNLPRYTLSTIIHPSPSFLELFITTMAVTEPKTTDPPTENMAVEEPKTVETKESTESPPAESTTERADAKTTTLPKDESTVESPSEIPAEESSKESEEKPKKRSSPTKQPEDHPDAKKIDVEAEVESKDNSTKAAVDPATKDDAPVVEAETANEKDDPRESKVPASTSAQWDSSGVTGVLTNVPGVDTITAGSLAFDELSRPHERVTNTYHLFGVYLTLKGPDDTLHGPIGSYEHNERFYQWLKVKGIVSHRSAIVKAVAEKCATFFAGDFYDANIYEEEEEEKKKEE